MATVPPGPKGHFLLGCLPAFARDILGFFTTCGRDHGDICRFRLGRQPAVHIAHPDLIEEVLVTRSRSFRKHRFFWSQVEAIFGSGLLTSEGELWLRQRRLAGHAFHRDRVTGYGDVMVELTERALDGWQDGEERDIHHDMMHLTMTIVARTLFAVEIPEDAYQVGQVFDTALGQVASRIRRPIRLPDFIPTPGNLHYRRTVARLDQLVYRILEERRRHGGGDDLLSMLLTVRDEDGSRMTDRQIRDETITLFLAGHETTAIALAWTFYLLSRHPEVEARLVAELDTVLAGRAPTPADVERLPFAKSVVMESMRLYPPAYGFGREAAEDVSIGDGYAIAKKTVVYMSQWVVHRDPRWYPDPDRFDPDRFAGDAAARRPRFAYFPFGGGPRVCIGMGFAMMEAVLLLATVMRRFHLRLVPDHPVEVFPSITLRPAHGVRVVVAKRQ